ncbi:MAG: TerC family protein, partial [Bacteriovoracia bacterium]
MALVSRIILLMGISWVVKLTQPLFAVFGRDISMRDLILILGGLFLMWKAMTEIYHKVEAKDAHGAHAPAKGTGTPPVTSGKPKLGGIITQIMIVDVVFSLDSVITAVGTAKHLGVMVAAVIISVLGMMIFARAIGDFVERRPSIKILALSFLVMIGTLLVAEGFGEHLNKGYVYFGMAFALVIEMLNMRFEKKTAIAAKGR